jgi:hypothetical protein
MNAFWLFMLFIVLPFLAGAFIRVGMRNDHED